LVEGIGVALSIHAQARHLLLCISLVLIGFSLSPVVR
jgi:hypothetical protein